ncbi:hypothetical protein ACFRI7_31700 [Streptomyces sp. NPDC056716]|uniref:hypothetical protein n=1 Tax=unclassified Streptomyces TaxID=2593676 RepID=UPI00369235DD
MGSPHQGGTVLPPGPTSLVAPGGLPAPMLKHAHHQPTDLTPFFAGRRHLAARRLQQHTDQIPHQDPRPEREKWITGACWLGCRRSGLPVIWIGPLHWNGRHAPLHACQACLNRLVHQAVNYWLQRGPAA